MQDSNVLLRTYLLTQTTLGALIGYTAPTVDPPYAGTIARIYIPRVPDVGVLPCISLFRRGGTATPYIPPWQSPSFQIDCWANDSLVSEQIYGALYDALQGIQRIAVTIGSDTYYIMSAWEEVQAQTLQDVDIPTRFSRSRIFQDFHHKSLNYGGKTWQNNISLRKHSLSRASPT